MPKKTIEPWGVLAFVGILVAAALVWIGMSAMEARAFNRATGRDVSTWDAMWIQLRVQGAANDT